MSYDADVRAGSRIKLHGDRAWALPAIFAVVGAAAAIVGVIVLVVELRGVNLHGPAVAGGVVATVLGGLIGYLGVAALREGGTYLVIDTAAGTLAHHAGRKIETFPLAELGGLVVVKYDPPRTDRRRSEVAFWHLRAERVPKPLFQSLSRDRVERRKTLIERLVRDATR